MKKNGLFIIIVLLTSLGFGINSISKTAGNYYDQNYPRANSTTTGDITFPFQKTLHLGDDNYWNMTDLLDVNQTLENIPSFEHPGVTSYEGDEAIPSISATMYLVKVIFYNTTIYDDHDGIGLGAGEIYFKITINGNYTKTENVDLDDDESWEYNFQVFYAW